jgi:hypothetical protein
MHPGMLPGSCAGDRPSYKAFCATESWHRGVGRRQDSSQHGFATIITGSQNDLGFDPRDDAGRRIEVSWHPVRRAHRRWLSLHATAAARSMGCTAAVSGPPPLNLRKRLVGGNCISRLPTTSSRSLWDVLSPARLITRDPHKDDARELSVVGLYVCSTSYTACDGSRNFKKNIPTPCLFSGMDR